MILEMYVSRELAELLMTKVISPSETDDDGSALFSFDGAGLRRWLVS